MTSRIHTCVSVFWCTLIDNWRCVVAIRVSTQRAPARTCQDVARDKSAEAGDSKSHGERDHVTRVPLGATSVGVMGPARQLQTARRCCLLQSAAQVGERAPRARARARQARAPWRSPVWDGGTRSRPVEGSGPANACWWAKLRLSRRWANARWFERTAHTWFRRATSCTIAARASRERRFTRICSSSSAPQST